MVWRRRCARLCCSSSHFYSRRFVGSPAAPDCSQADLGCSNVDREPTPREQGGRHLSNEKKPFGVARQTVMASCSARIAGTRAFLLPFAWSSRAFVQRPTYERASLPIHLGLVSPLIGRYALGWAGANQPCD